MRLRHPTKKGELITSEEEAKRYHDIFAEMYPVWYEGLKRNVATVPKFVLEARIRNTILGPGSPIAVSDREQLLSATLFELDYLFYLKGN